MSDPSLRQQPSGWASAGVTFAGCILGLIGSFQLIAGLTAILNDDFFVRTENYTFDLDTTAWGWIHLLIGVLLIITAFGLFSGAPVGGRGGDRPRDPERDRELLLHPLLPLLVDRADRARRLGHLGADAAGGAQDGVSRSRAASIRGSTCTRPARPARASSSTSGAATVAPGAAINPASGGSWAICA